MRNYRSFENMSLVISPSLLCNLRCGFCFQTSFDHSVFLNVRILYEELRPAYLHTTDLLLLGGEITITPGMKEYVRYLKSSFPNIRIAMVTNGAQFNEEWIELAAETGLKVTVSLNASNGNTYHADQSRGNGRKIWKRTLTNVVKTIIKEQQIQRPILDKLSMVITRNTYTDVRSFVMMAFFLRVNVKILYNCNGVDEKSAEVTGS